MKKVDIITIGSRKSILAMTQARLVMDMLKKAFPNYKFVIKKIVTSGDRLKKWPTEQVKGLFVKEIEQALIQGKIDLAVHSMKDLPVEMPKELEIAAITKRADARDVLISHSGKKLDDLELKSCIGTSSPRRKAQLLLYRPDLNIVNIRGNLDTRLKKLNDKQFDAIVLAAAGIIRLGWQGLITEYINENIILPAPGQGVLGVQVRKKDKNVKAMVKILDHSSSRSEVTAERAFLKSMGGGCRVPIGCLAKIRADVLSLKAIVAFTQTGAVKLAVKTNKKYPLKAGQELARRIKKLLNQKVKKGKSR
ncbi:MAG: hydroxymethylbilane synthase [Candidatus Omnitrophica bacterium]|nr:hydroxymethylbilane synthase [Candidatus Omnitrophota bacterium]